MNPKKDEKQLDELIRRTINTTEPQFDAEKWKQKYPGQFHILQSRATRNLVHPVLWTDIIKSPIIKFAVAAVIIVVLGFFFRREKLPEIEPTTKSVPESQSSTQMISMMSMRRTYQRGGFDALDQQFRDTLDVLGPRSSSISIHELLEGINGS